ncbi:TorF family putative porin [Pseudoduganella ginsengisoli]|uniref:Uncharacterized protein n=1 Tax=Pseudoduganella ginsengisoli TaxID=1462440 RepID=A0A6L6Q5A1_9BURK|nr:TorF family putative porin [Pseudoduganella ginsengisoli]MTW04870.1 hypothetical protein [Pseudoduganella ginsengisoli]
MQYVFAMMAGMACAFAAHAEETPAWTETGNVTLLSDYVFRGVSQTQGKPTAQATVEFAHRGGAYAGMFGSGVSHAAYNNGDGAEIDLYGGYRHVLDEQSNIDAGVVTYWYPGARYVAGTQTIRYHTADVKLGWNRGSFNAYGWVTVSSHWFGYAVNPYSGKVADTRGTTYVEANWNPELAPGLAANLHIGRQTVRHLGMYSFTDVKAGVTQTWGNWALCGAAIYNNGKVHDGALPLWVFFNADGSGKRVVGKRVQVTLARNF